MKKRVAVVLSGCGVQDGSEIHEAVLTLLYLAKAGAEPLCFGLNVEQKRVVNHYNGELMGETRNALVESARIARGSIRDISAANVDDLDALVMPGGLGAALNLSDFAVSGPTGAVHPDLRRLVESFHAAGKPIGALCIAPATLAMILGDQGIMVTVGSEGQTSQAIRRTGARHQACTVDDCVVDTKHKIVTTPAYMLGPDIAHIALGIEKLCRALVDLA